MGRLQKKYKIYFPALDTGKKANYIFQRATSLVALLFFESMESIFPSIASTIDSDTEGIPLHTKTRPFEGYLH